MTSTKHILTATAVSYLAVVMGVFSCQAADASTGLAMKPLAGVSFDIGTRNATGYFINEKGLCKLVVTMADDPDWSAEVVGLQVTRFEADVPGGKATRLPAGDGRSIEFRCQPGGESMTVHGARQLAAGDLR